MKQNLVLKDLQMQGPDGAINHLIAPRRHESHENKKQEIKLGLPRLKPFDQNQTVKISKCVIPYF